MGLKIIAGGLLLLGVGMLGVVNIPYFAIIVGVILIIGGLGVLLGF